MDRRIAAIFVADMVGSTRLMERDERDVITRHKAHLSEVFEPEFAARRGRVIKGTGDGLIGVFDSVVDALEAALAIQKAMAEREAEGDRQIAYRIAIHLGDVMFDEDDVYGDGVNIAARLEGEAEPGGIVVSGAARDMLKDQVDVSYGSLGDLAVKGVSEPVRAYVVGAEGRKQTRRLMPVLSAIAAALLLIAGGAVWWSSSQPDFPPADPNQMAEEFPDQPSIVVQEFKNLTGDDELAWLSEGLAENVIAALSAVPEMLVIGASTAFAATNETVTQSAQRVGARYVLSGLIQADSGELRVSSALSDAKTGQRVWSANWTRDRQSLFSLQDEIAQMILHALNLEVVYGGRASDWAEFADSPEQYRKLVEGRRSFMRYLPAENANALKLFTDVVRSHPKSVMAQDWLGWTHLQRVLLGFSDDIAADIGTAFKQADITKRLGSDRHFGLRSNLAAITRDHENARKYAVAAVNAMPNNSDLVAIAGWALHVAGDAAQGAELMARAIRMDRAAPDKRWVPAALAEAFVSLGRIDEARTVAERALTQYADEPRWVPVFLERLVVIEGAAGNLDLAAKYAAEIKANAPWWKPGVRKAQLAINADQEAVERYLSHLRSAGLDY